MSEANFELLSRLLDRLTNTMLQYAADSWNWTASGDAERKQTVQGLVQRQQFSAERLADFLRQHDIVVRLANFPFDGTLLNYVTLDYFKPRLIADEEELVQELRSAQSAANGDPEAERLLQTLLAEEENTLESVRSL